MSPTRTPISRSMARRLGIRGAALTAAALLALSLTGCGADDVAERIAERVAQQEADGRVDVDVDGDVDDEEVTVTTDEGSFASSSELPQGFPSGDVPLIDGEVTLGMDAAGQGYTVVIETDTTADNGLSRIANDLTQAGFSKRNDASIADILVFESSQWTVSVSAADGAQGTLFSYLVSAAD